MENQVKDDETDLLAYTERHYNNPKLNHIENNQEFSIDFMKSKTRLMLRIPSALKKSGVYNLMSIFGEVLDVHMVSKNPLSNRTLAFVEFRTFSEAEKAYREINNISNRGLHIQAEFANIRNNEPRLKHDDDKPTATTSKSNDNGFDTEIVNDPAETRLPITIKFQEHAIDDDYEKMSFFEFKKRKLTKKEQLALEELKKRATASNGTFDNEKKIFKFNEKLRDNFLTFYCHTCENEGIFKTIDGGNKMYFCSQKCFKKFNDCPSPSSSIETVEVGIKKLDQVIITAVMNEKCVYVRSSKEDLTPILDKVYSIGRKASKCNETTPEVGKMVLVKLFDDIYRGTIMKESTETDENGLQGYIVRLNDIGNTVRVMQADLLTYQNECDSVKIVTHKVLLKNVNVEAINMSVVDYLLNLKEDKIELTITSIDNNEVELKDGRDNTNINQKIVKLANIENALFKPIDFIQFGIKSGQDKKLFVINATYLETMGDVVCIEEKYLKDFYELFKSLNAYGKKIDPKTCGIPQIEKPVLVKYNDQWHRALVTETKGDGRPSCYLADIQLQATIDVRNIFPLPSVLASAPIYTEACKIKNFNPEGKECNECNKFLRELFIENEFVNVDKVEFINNEQCGIQLSQYDNFHNDHQC